jgi:hypothetical protein
MNRDPPSGSGCERGFAMRMKWTHGVHLKCENSLERVPHAFPCTVIVTQPECQLCARWNLGSSPMCGDSTKSGKVASRKHEWPLVWVLLDKDLMGYQVLPSSQPCIPEELCQTYS